MHVARLSIAQRTICFDRAVCRGVHVPGPLSGIPNAPGWMLGAWAYLGRVVAVIDLAQLGAWGSVARPVPALLLIEVGKDLLAIAADEDLGDAQIPPPDRSDALYDVIQTVGANADSNAQPTLLLEAARLTLECEAALLRGVRSESSR